MYDKLGVFDPAFDYLGDNNIRALQFLIDEIVRSDKDRETNLEKLESAYQALFLQYSKEARGNDFNLRQLVRFVRKNLSIMDKGGILLGRSRVGDLISKFNAELLAKHADLIAAMGVME